MKRIVLAVICTAFVASTMAAPKPCKELKDEIEARSKQKT